MSLFTTDAVTGDKEGAIIHKATCTFGTSLTTITLSMRSANILAHGLYTRCVMHQYIGARVFTHVSSKAKRTFGVNPFLLSSNKYRPHLSTYITSRKGERAVLVRHRSRRAAKVKLFLQHREEVASIFHISWEY